ncbi:uncharacterized protein ARMOST_15275 [Armillaria ostoyae]|uniref:CCHC-type domain-containing protein n=1 Tax=Armillaria ostoyae TaxID=47428 RepID=A0A284RSX9_ARMOS|nr:uncharacterized protein ARMOST_15275 [Armillaria ostoyae]
MLMEQSRDAPRLETLNPWAIQKHFRILEGMFKAHEGASTDDEKKDWAVCYTDTDIKDQWRAFPTFDSVKTWDEFKEEVLCSYDGAAEEDEDARKGLMKVANKYKKEGIMDSADYLNYRREFQAKSKQVVKEGLMSNLDLVQLFILPFKKDTLWKHMKDRLGSQPVVATMANPARNACDPWALEDMFNTGNWVLKGPGTVYNELFDGLLPTIDSTPKVEAESAPSPRAMVTYKKEPTTAELPDEVNNFLAKMADSNRLIVKLLETQVSSQSKRDEELHKMLAQIKTQPRITQAVPVSSTHGQYGSNAPGNCHFCETPGHYQVDCPYKLEMITTRELVHVPGTQNMYRLWDRNPPPREPAGMSPRARIQHYYKMHKASGSNPVGQTYIMALQLSGPVPQYVMSHQIAEEKEDISYLKNMLEKLVQQTSHMAPEKVDQHLEGPQWDSIVKTRGQRRQEASQANDSLQDTQDFHKHSMKAVEHHKKAAVVTGPGDSSPEDVNQNQK